VIQHARRPVQREHPVLWIIVLSVTIAMLYAVTVALLAGHLPSPGASSFVSQHEARSRRGESSRMTITRIVAVT
jgi:hypothetical protein